MVFECLTNVPSFAFKPTLSDCNLKNQTLTRRFKTAIFRKNRDSQIAKSSPEITFCISDELKMLLQDIQNLVLKCKGQMLNGKN